MFPLAAAALAWPILGETLSATQLAGAAGVLLIHTTESASYPWSVPANGMMLNWRRSGEAGGTVTPKWSALKNTQIDELATSRNNYTVSVQNEISSVVGVYLGTVASGVNYYSRRQDRQYSFDGREITLGTNLPGARMAVIVRYVFLLFRAPEKSDAENVSSGL